MSRKQPARHTAHAPAALVLLVIALAVTGLAVYQWFELRVVESGGRVMCAVNESINCETVWTSPMAQAIHRAVGVPVAGLGLLWGAVAAAGAAWLLIRARSGRPIRDEMGAVRITAGMGLLGTGVFAAGSFAAGAICLTCLLTYVLVLSFSGVAFFALPRPWFPTGGEWWSALGFPSVMAIIAYIVLLIPGRTEPRRATALTRATTGPAALPTFLARATPMERQAWSDALSVYRTMPIPADRPPERNRLGEASAPVKVVEWTDIRCPHCKHFNEKLESLLALLPTGSLSVEVRNFPLDGACNPVIAQSAGGLSCDGALALICLERAPDFWRLREKLFEAQNSLTRDRILEIATSSFTVTRPELEACMVSADTRARLAEDIRYAQLYNPTGTPTITVNGRLAPTLDSFVYILAMTGGNPDAPVLASLPAPRHASRK